MKYEDYNDFYNEVISKYIGELVSFDAQNCNCLSFDPKSIKRIYKNYERKRIEIRNLYMLDSSKPIDRHKTAACMIYAILNAKVFRVNLLKGSLPEVLRLANEYLALYVSINILEQYKRKDSQTDNSIPSDYTIRFPKTSYEKQQNDMTGEVAENFVSSLALTLANIKSMKYFDFFSYATILFLLENYTDTCLIYEQDRLITDL